jgi:hypothetical protein
MAPSQPARRDNTLALISLVALNAIAIAQLPIHLHFQNFGFHDQG